MERDILVQQVEMNWLVKVDQFHNSQLVHVSACVCWDIEHMESVGEHERGRISY